MTRTKLKRITKLLCTFCALLLMLPGLFAQNNGAAKRVTGTVKDDKGAAIAGVTVQVKDAKNVTVTNAQGVFAFDVPTKAATIIFSYVGMQKVETAITASGIMEITLMPITQSLNDVVVIGYGVTKRANITSSISSVNQKQLKDLPVAGIDQALQGKVAGLNVVNNSGQPGGGVSLRVRGVTSINSNDPLIVIDGVRFRNSEKTNAGFAGLGGSDGQTSNSVMSTINPNDIESIDVLKDASAQAIYGSEAANGVILITTKKGKSGEGKINYDVYYGQQQVYRKLDLMNLQQFATYQNSIVGELGRDSTEEFKDPSVLGRGTDWQDAIFQNGNIQDHNLSFSGGKDKTTYYLSLNYFDQTGILIGSDFNRYAMRFNLDNQLKTWLKVGVSSNVSRTTQNVTLADAAEGTIWWGAIQNPLIPLKNLDGTWGGGNVISGYQYASDNPVARAQLRGNKSISSQVFGNVYADLQLSKNLSFRNEVSYSIGLNNNQAVQQSGYIGPSSLQSQLFEYKGNSYYYSLRNYLTYNKYWGKHGINVTAGHEMQYSYYEGMSGKKVDLQAGIPDLNAGNSDKTTWELGGGKGDWAAESYFARGNYTYDNRYSLSVSMRADGSSNFGPTNRWGYFPGASAGWTITNEKFAENWKSTFSYLKLRVGYGAVGNQNPPGGAARPFYTGGVRFWAGPVGFGSGSNFLTGIANPDVTWESVVTQNAGIDVGILKGKIDLTVDVYKKTTTNMLIIGTAGRTVGLGDSWDDLTGPLINVGQMTNTGIDLSITTHNITNKNFTWNTNLIFTHYKNQLDRLVTGAALYGKVYYDNYTLTKTVASDAVGTFYGLQTDGIFRTQEELDASMPQFGYSIDATHTWLGDIRFKDINNDKKIDEGDITNIGSPLPKFTYGLTNTFKYKNFDASIFVQGSYGSKIYNFLRWQTEKMDNPYYNQLTSVLNRYTADNINGDLPRFSNTNVNNVYVSDRYIEDGSYLRIQNITIGYRMPEKIAKKAMMTSMRFYVSVQNLYTFTSYSGYDPEVGVFNNNIRLQNIDMGHYPNPRSVTIGANVEF